MDSEIQKQDGAQEVRRSSLHEVLACPFCGETWCSIRNAGNNGVLRQVYCRDVDCGARGPARPSEDHAIAAWNNRRPIEAALKLLEASEQPFYEACKMLRQANDQAQRPHD